MLVRQRLPGRREIGSSAGELCPCGHGRKTLGLTPPGETFEDTKVIAGVVPV